MHLIICFVLLIALKYHLENIEKQGLQSESQKCTLLSGQLNACQDSWLVEVGCVFAWTGV